MDTALRGEHRPDPSALLALYVVSGWAIEADPEPGEESPSTERLEATS